MAEKTTPYRPILPPKAGCAERDGQYHPTEETRQMLQLKERLRDLATAVISDAGTEEHDQAMETLNTMRMENADEKSPVERRFSVRSEELQAMPGIDPSRDG